MWNLNTESPNGLKSESEREQELIVEKVFSIAESGDYIALHECFEAFSNKIPDLANCRDADEDTPLIVASQAGSLQCMEVLLAQGAYVNSCGCSARTALHCAAFEGHTDAVVK